MDTHYCQYTMTSSHKRFLVSGENPGDKISPTKFVNIQYGQEKWM